MKKRNVIMMFAMCMVLAAGCSKTENSEVTANQAESLTESVAETTAEDYNGKLVMDYSLELKYSKNFAIDYYKGGYKMITTNDGEGNESSYLIVPENMTVPSEGVDSKTVVLQQPIENVMSASNPSTALINAIGALDRVALTTSDADTWYIDDIKKAMTDGKLTYVGSSTEPDYEKITEAKTSLAIYTRMLSDDVKAQFDNIGVNVICDYSSVEENPLARVEWAYVYAAMFDLEDEAAKLVEEQTAVVDGIKAPEGDKKSVAVFYITSKGKLYARNADDYMAMMVEDAGAEYALSDVGVGESGTVNMEIEAFYEKAKDADYILYVWSMGGKPETLDDLTSKSELLKDFKAVKDGNVWCTTPDYFQATNAIGDMVADLNKVISGADESEVTYLKNLK